MNTQSRRTFIKTGILGTTGLILGVRSTATSATLIKLAQENLTSELNPFVSISSDGTITLVNSRTDMGQGSIQAVSSLIAEDLEVELSQIRIVSSDGTSKYGSQLAGASSTVRSLWTPLRQAGAAAREMLTQAAAKRWNIDPGECFAREARVFNRQNDKSFSYGELAAEASALEVPKEPKLKPSHEFRILGKSNKRPDVPSKTDGSAVYAMDVDIPGMLYAMTIHPPAIHSKLRSFDASKALTIKGVRYVIRTERFVPAGKVAPANAAFSFWSGFESRDAIAVVADSYALALKASKLVDAQWDDTGTNEIVDSPRYVNELYQASSPGAIAESEGDFETSFAQRVEKLEAVYETPFLAHAAIEPVNATVHVRDDGTVDIWASVQGADWALDQAALYLGIDKQNIRVHTKLLGGSFGRKGFMDFLLEALDISRKIKAPVKLIWTREQEMTQGPYRPAMLSKLKGIVKDRSLFGLSHQAIGESIQGQHWNGTLPGQADSWIAGELSKGNHKYNFAVYRLSYSRVKTTIPVLWWRSVYASNFAWGQECFIDEMAHRAGIPPLEARKSLLANSPRDLKILEKIEEISDRPGFLPEGHACGIAMFRSFESMSAALVQVTQEKGAIKIVRVISVIDCGLCINPDNVKAQTEGNIVMGLSAAIRNGITFSNGKCDQTNFHQYQVLRFHEMPSIEVHIMDNQEKPGGVGEPGLPPIAPALGNAIYNLTGKRHRKLPLSLGSPG